MNKIPNNSHQCPAASAASGVNKVGFWPAKDCLLQTQVWIGVMMIGIHCSSNRLRGRSCVTDAAAAFIILTGLIREQTALLCGEGGGNSELFIHEKR